MNPDSTRQRHTARDFPGFDPLNANYVYCPNQFFDVCLPNCSRGAVRIVAYLLRQTLGWLDREGNPVSQEITVSYTDLIRKAGISRGAIGPALKEVVDAGFIDCVQTARRKTSGDAGRPAIYSLRWDRSEKYKNTTQDFRGLYTGEGYRTPVPNRFFDVVVRQETLAVVKVVGTIIRHTIGYQNQFGGRRESHPLSYGRIQQYSNLRDRSTLSQAISQAISTGYIACLEAGKFASNKSQQKSAVYGVRWEGQAANQNISSKIRPEKDQFKNPTSNGSKKQSDDRFKNPTSIKKKLSNNTLKQQDAAASNSSIALLLKAGFDSSTVNDLAKKRGLDVIKNQIAWLDARKPDKPIAMLRKAISENWEKPTAIIEQEKQKLRRHKEQTRNEQHAVEDQQIEARKTVRRERKAALLSKWESASDDERKRWIERAVERETSSRIQDLIRREKYDSLTPRLQILDALAADQSLPMIMQIGE